MTIPAVNDGPREFEERALAIARSIYDPSGTQGPVMFRGREHDAVFIDDRSIVAFEFTMMKTKDKANKDGVKLADILEDVCGRPENRYKSVQGFFVTNSEPTAEQKQAIQHIVTSRGVPIHAISVLTLRNQLIDSEAYLRLRREAPFGSANYKVAGSANDRVERYVRPSIVGSGGESFTIDDLMQKLERAERVTLTADYGSGKSEALRQTFEAMRKAYFKHPYRNKIPLHVNLRECFGLRSPREVLRRHAEEIGFPNGESLIAAWRSGACALLLDGFDELVPSRWVGGAKDLKQVRWQALEAVRRLVIETPVQCGVVIVGRPQFFASNGELLEALGIGEGGELLQLEDFDSSRVQEFVGEGLAVPEWVPTRPLLLKFLVLNGVIGQLDGADSSPGDAWLKMLGLIASRESERVSSVTKDSVLALMARIATIARSSESPVGPIPVADMRKAFQEICGYDPDEEGLQLLLRLPGLSSEGPSGDELRRFVDEEFANAAYGFDLAQYMGSPYSSHPLSESSQWSISSDGLASSVAASSLEALGFEGGSINSVVRHRVDVGMFDAITLDCALVAQHFGPVSAPASPILSEVLVGNISAAGGKSAMSHAQFADCVIDFLDVSDVETPSEFPTFVRCTIGEVVGWSSVPADFGAHFVDCDLLSFSAPSGTNVGLVESAIDDLSTVALIVLKKIYAQAGRGRRSSGLDRGMPLELRPLVPGVVEKLSARGFATFATRRSETIVLPVRDKRRQVMLWLSMPHQFGIELLDVTSS